MSPRIAIAIALALSVAAAPLSAEEQSASTQLKKELGEAGEAIKNYSVEQRDEAVNNARQALDQMDARINRLAADIDGKWEQLDATARKKAYESMDRLRKERNDAAEWMGALKHGSKEAWGEAKNGFSRSYDALVNSLSRAREEF